MIIHANFHVRFKSLPLVYLNSMGYQDDIARALLVADDFCATSTSQAECTHLSSLLNSPTSVNCHRSCLSHLSQFNISLPSVIAAQTSNRFYQLVPAFASKVFYLPCSCHFLPLWRSAHYKRPSFLRISCPRTDKGIGGIDIPSQVMCLAFKHLETTSPKTAAYVAVLGVHCPQSSHFRLQHESIQKYSSPFVETCFMQNAIFLQPAQKFSRRAHTPGLIVRENDVYV